MTREKFERRSLLAGMPVSWFNPYTNPLSAAAFMRAFDQAAQRCDLYACEHDHSECSTHHHGPCFDEVLANFPDIDGSD